MELDAHSYPEKPSCDFIISKTRVTLAWVYRESFYGKNKEKKINNGFLLDKIWFQWLSNGQ